MSFYLLSQSDKQIEREWNKDASKTSYGKEKNDKHQDWNANSPLKGNEYNETYDNQNEENPIQGILDKKIEKESVSTKKRKIVPPKEIEIPEFEEPDFDEPDVDIDPVDIGKIPQGFWQFMLFILIFAAIILIVYLVLKRLNPSGSIAQEVDDYWNPEVVTKTELELRLESALARDDFREAIRVYFTMILQELIRINEIKWKREKTNHQYLQEIKSVGRKSSFSRVVRLFEIVWYGEYAIDYLRYKEIEPELIQFLQTLKKENLG